MYKHKSIQEINQELTKLKTVYANNFERIISVIERYESYEIMPWATIAGCLNNGKIGFSTSGAAVKEFDRQYQLAKLNGTSHKFLNS